MNKKGQQGLGLGTLITAVIIFLLAGLAAIYSLDITEDTAETMCTDDGHHWVVNTCLGCESATYPNFNASDSKCYNATTGDLKNTPAIPAGHTSTNATASTSQGITKIPQKMPTLANVTIAAIIIGVLLVAFGGFIAYRRNR